MSAQAGFVFRDMRIIAEQPEVREGVQLHRPPGEEEQGDEGEKEHEGEEQEGEEQGDEGEEEQGDEGEEGGAQEVLRHHHVKQAKKTKKDQRKGDRHKNGNRSKERWNTDRATLADMTRTITTFHVTLSKRNAQIADLKADIRDYRESLRMCREAFVAMHVVHGCQRRFARLSHPRPVCRPKPVLFSET